MSLARDVLDHALTLGFDLAATIPAGPPRSGQRFAAWLEAGYQGEMAYMAARLAERLDPALLAPAAASMIVVASSYAWAPEGDPAAPAGASQGRFARFSRQPDYHTSMKRRLYALDEHLRRRTGRTSLGKVCVDTAPLLERDAAARAGLGFIGRNACLITPGLGSWTLLGVLLVPEDLATDIGQAAGRPPQQGRAPESCGQCTRCLDACPTQAFAAPYTLDARRCISYLTIELRGPIPRDLRAGIGDWVFGCDICQERCPYNRHVPVAGAARTPAAVPLADLLRLDEAGFRERFRGTTITRTRRRGLVRNACVAAGNSGDRGLVPDLIPLLADPEPLVRGHAAWALSRLGGRAGLADVDRALARESDAWVEAELRAALAEWGAEAASPQA